MAENTSFWNHPIERFEEAVNIKRTIAALEQRLKGLFGGETVAVPAEVRKGGRKRSAATRAKMAAAQQARWAKKKQTTTASDTTPPKDTAPKESTSKATATKGTAKKSGRRMSAARRKKIAEAMKASWAAKRKSAKGS